MVNYNKFLPLVFLLLFAAVSLMATNMCSSDRNDRKRVVTTTTEVRRHHNDAGTVVRRDNRGAFMRIRARHASPYETPQEYRGRDNRKKYTTTTVTREKTKVVAQTTPAQTPERVRANRQAVEQENRPVSRHCKHHHTWFKSCVCS